MTCPPAVSNCVLRDFTPVRYRLSPSRRNVDRKGIEPFTSSMPRRTAHQRRATHDVGYRGVEPRNSWSQTRRPTVGPVPDMAGESPRKTPPALCHAIHCGILKYTIPHRPMGPEGSARAAGVEPATSGVGDRRSDRLSYARMRLVVQQKTARSLIGAGGGNAEFRYLGHPIEFPCCFASSTRTVAQRGMPNSDADMGVV